MKIHPVTQANFPQAANVYRASWRDSHKDICTPEFLERRDCDGYLQQRLSGLFLLTEDVPVGIVRIHDGVLSDLYVHPAFQGRGYGKKLVSFAMGQEPGLRLTVLSTNRKAIGLYRSYGFCFTGNDCLLRENLWEREMMITEK